MGDNVNANASAAATLYDLLIFLLEIFLEFLLIVVSLDLFGLSTVLVDRMISLILVILVIICLLFSWIKSFAKLLIYSTIQKPDYRQLATPSFLASTRPFPFKGEQYKRWRMRAVYWF